MQHGLAENPLPISQDAYFLGSPLANRPGTTVHHRLGRIYHGTVPSLSAADTPELVAPAKVYTYQRFNMHTVFPTNVLC